MHDSNHPSTYHRKYVEACNELQRSAEPLCYIGLFMWPEKRTLFFLGEPVNLSLQTYLVMYYMMLDPSRAYSRENILDLLEIDVFERTIDTAIKIIRMRLSEIHPEGSRVIETIHGYGYRLWQKHTI